MLHRFLFVAISLCVCSRAQGNIVDGCQAHSGCVIQQHAELQPRTVSYLNALRSDMSSLRGGDERPKHLELNSPITYITDCKDENGKGRLKARLATLFRGNSVSFVGVSSDYEAAINLVDIVDAYGEGPGVILANVARREGHTRKQKWPNGPPFGWLRVGQIDIFTTIDGYIVSLLQRMKQTPFSIDLYEIPATVPHMGLSAERQAHVINTQFRSFDYLPLLAGQLCAGAPLPVSSTMSEVPPMPLALCWVDSFGNCKTNALPEDCGFQVGREVVLKVEEQRQFVFPCYSRLKDVPDNLVSLPAIQLICPCTLQFI